MDPREDEITRILQFIREHPESYASLAVCRRALDTGLDSVSSTIIHDLDHHLRAAPDDEIDAYYTIIN